MPKVRYLQGKVAVEVIRTNREGTRCWIRLDGDNYVVNANRLSESVA